MIFSQSQYAPILSGQMAPQDAPTLPQTGLNLSVSPATQSIMAGGGGDQPYDWGKEMRQLGKKNMKFDNLPATEITKRVAAKSGVPASLLFSSAYIEGMNRAISKPDDVSEAYLNANVEIDYPVDGFYNYGVDTFGNRYNELKKYLPQGFESRFKIYKAKNEKNEWIKTAAFKTNEDALMAKAAFIKSEADRVQNAAKAKGIVLDERAKNYLTLASYNGGWGNARIILDEYAKAKDKSAFIEQGQTSRKGVHKNIITRLRSMATAEELLR